ncbi:MAG: hypothetical protein ACRCXZ_06540 [Patescibacteria group bacterium]
MKNLKQFATSMSVAFGRGQATIPFGFFEFNVEGDVLFTASREGIQFRIQQSTDFEAFLSLYIDNELSVSWTVTSKSSVYLDKEIASAMLKMIELPMVKPRIVRTGVYGYYLNEISKVSASEYFIQMTCLDGEGSSITFERTYSGPSELTKLAYLYLTLKQESRIILTEPENLSTHIGLLLNQENFDKMVKYKVHDLINHSIGKVDFWTPFG